MVKVDCNYKIKEDIAFLLESEGINKNELSEGTKIARLTLDGIEKSGKTTDEVCEKFYAYAYGKNYRINSVREELAKERYKNILFHGSKNGLTEISPDGSRENCDFGSGFYLGETYGQALAFVCENKDSSVYSFRYSTTGLTTKTFECSLDWMLAICYYRGTLGEFAESEAVRKIVAETENADLIIAPIADNRMFYIMTQFAEGMINADVALHSLSASKLGLQYVFKTAKAIRKLVPFERYYLCGPEREDCKRRLAERSFEIDTKLKLAMREYKNGLFIEEMLR